MSSRARRLPVIYLAGAIRDNRPDDVAWREKVQEALHNKAVFLNPLGAKTFDPETGLWHVSGVLATATNIFKHDQWSVRHADIVLANLTALTEGYPNIGTLVEFGMAAERGCLIYSIVDQNYTGHGNLKLYKLHPFLSQPSAVVFESVDKAISFLDRHLDVLSGANAMFDGVKIHEPEVVPENSDLGR